MTKKTASTSLVVRQQRTLAVISSQIDQVGNAGKKYQLRREESRLLTVAGRHQMNEREARQFVQLLEQHTNRVLGTTIRRIEKLMIELDLDVQDIAAIYDFRACFEGEAGDVLTLELIYEVFQFVPGVSLDTPTSDGDQYENVSILIDVIHEVYDIEEEHIGRKQVFRLIQDCKKLVSNNQSKHITVVDLREFVAKKSLRVMRSRMEDFYN